MDVAMMEVRKDEYIKNLAERDNLAKALFEVVDAVAGLDRPWDLEGHGITSKRAEEICELAALGRHT